MKYLLTIISILSIAQISLAQMAMVGACDMREANILLQLNEDNHKDIIAKATNAGKTYLGRITQEANVNNEFVAKVVFSGLSANKQYDYSIDIGDGTDVLKGKFKTKPDYLGRTPPPDFSFVVLGSHYVNDKEFDDAFRIPGSGYEIFDMVDSVSPDFVIWGANSSVFRTSDKGSKSAMMNRYTYDRKLKESKNIFANYPNYSVLSKQSYGDGDKMMSNKKDALSSFDNFWINPSSYLSTKTYSFTYSDTEFFILDDSSAKNNLDYNDIHRELLGEEQFLWLISNLEQSKAMFKIVIMNTPIVNPIDKNPLNYANFKNERNKLLSVISEKKITGLMFIGANKDYFEATSLIRAGAYPLFEVMVGSLTNRPAKEISEINYFRLPTSALLDKGFVQIKVEGAENDRSIRINIIDSTGKIAYTTQLNESSLREFN